jgi:hypothetical protein
MTHKINPIVVVKVVDLDISRIYSHNHMVGMDNFFSNEWTFKVEKYGLVV